MEETTSINEIEAAIEAILYAAGYPITYEKLSDVLGLGTKDIKKIVSHMAENYNSYDCGRGVNLLMFDDSCQLCTKEQFAPYIREALGIRRGGNLSASSLEVLAVVAYNQPVTRAFVDTVRGVDSTYAVNSLIDKELIVACGRLDAPGRPVLYKTTEKFLRVFGINSLKELPTIDKSELPVLENSDSSQSEASMEDNNTENPQPQSEETTEKSE